MKRKPKYVKNQMVEYIGDDDIFENGKQYKFKHQNGNTAYLVADDGYEYDVPTKYIKSVVVDDSQIKYVSGKEAICAYIDGKKVQFKRPNTDVWLDFTDKQTVYLLTHPQSKFTIKE